MLFNSVITAAILAYTAVAAPANNTPSYSPPASGQNSSDIPPSIPTGPDPTLAVSDDILAKIITAPLTLDRFDALSKDANFVFDFKATKLNVNNGGGVLAVANRKAFPALVGSGSGMAVGFLDGCGFNTPHVHPRATELQIVINGTIVTEMVPENGVFITAGDSKSGRRVIKNTLKPFQMTPFYQGSIHTQFNPDCEPATFIASFNAEDFGAGQVLDETFNLDANIVTAAFGEAIDGNRVTEFKGKIPPTIAKGVQECLNKCPNIKKGN